MQWWRWTPPPDLHVASPVQCWRSACSLVTNHPPKWTSCSKHAWKQGETLHKQPTRPAKSHSLTFPLDLAAINADGGEGKLWIGNWLGQESFVSPVPMADVSFMFYHRDSILAVVVSCLKMCRKALSQHWSLFRFTIIVSIHCTKEGKHFFSLAGQLNHSKYKDVKPREYGKIYRYLVVRHMHIHY